MCLSESKRWCIACLENPPIQTEFMAANVRADKAFGMVLTSLLAIALSADRFNLVSHMQAKSLTFGVLLLFVVGKAIQMGRHYWGQVVVKCVHQVDDVMMRVSSSHALTRIRSSVSASSMRLVDFAIGRDTGRGVETRSPSRRSPEITANTPFLPVQTTADLSLCDIKHLMRFAVDVNKRDFDEMSFLSKLSEPCREAVDAIDRVVMASHGYNTAISKSPIRENYPVAGDVDALVFTAVVRIFAEWRSLRLVPDGHQRYAIGMGLAKRDLIQNAQKIETAVHDWINDNERSRCASFEMANGCQVSSMILQCDFRPLHLLTRLLTWVLLCSCPVQPSDSS
jgi:hypothetical protein